MGPAELWERGAQAARARADAWDARRRAGYPDAERFLARLFPLDPEARPAALAEGWRSSPFWFDHAERSDRAAALAEEVPEVAAGVLRTANAAVAGRVELFGHIEATVCDPSDWHRCPMTGRVWPRRPWREIDTMPGNPVGDVKFVWELNRHAHFLALGQAAALTGEQRFGDALAAQMRGWLAQNPPGVGVHWCDSLEVAIRALAWLWATRLAIDLPGFGSEAEIDAARLLGCSARRLWRFLSTYSSPNTHLLGEALALWTIAVACPWFPEARRWRRRGWALLTSAICTQIRPDGGHVEQSASYHRYALEMALLAVTLARRAGEIVPEEVSDRVAAAVAFAGELTGPDGLLPPIGDCDGGATLPLMHRDPHDARGWLAVAGALGMTQDPAELPSAEIIWLVGTCSAAKRKPGPPTAVTTRIFAETGLVVMKATDRCLVFDAGPHGFGRAGHGHADALGIELSLGEERVLLDPGTFQYGAPAPWRDAFRSAAAHNTILIDGIEPATPEGPFGWARRVEGRLEDGMRNGAWVVGWHDGYQSLGDPVTVERRVAFCQGEYWVIDDYVVGRDRHTADLLFHLDPGAGIERGASGKVRVRTAGGRVLWLISIGSDEIDVVTGQPEAPWGWVSPRYGERIAAPVVRFRHRRVAPFRCRTLLLPADPGAPEPDMDRIQTELSEGSVA
jgi:hypothetical protein